MAATAESTARPAAVGEEPRATPRKRREWFLPTYTTLVFAYLLVPILIMAMFGFNDHTGRFNLTWEGFTLEHYRTIFQIPELVSSLKNSLVIAALSTVVATILGTLIALALTRFRFRGRSSLNLFIFIPMATPEIILGVSLLAMFVSLNVTTGFMTILIAHIMFCISYVVVTVKARTSGLDGSLEEAASDLGATPWVTFWTVTFPLIFPGIMAAALLAFVLSIDDYVITTFNSGATVTFPLWIYGVSRFGVPAQVNVMGTIIFSIGVVYVIVSLVREKRKSFMPSGRQMSYSDT
ncbi:MAG: ABC transporter permease [Actinomycetota bacterium]|nr:ABC transporter permease [Actinomycetota bacterium]